MAKQVLYKDDDMTKIFKVCKRTLKRWRKDNAEVSKAFIKVGTSNRWNVAKVNEFLDTGEIEDDDV